MTIDPKLYEKYTGKRPGDAMSKLGQTLAQDSARRPAGDTSYLGALARGKKITMIVGGILVAIAAIYFMMTMKNGV